jgi:hypothetical protein
LVLGDFVNLDKYEVVSTELLADKDKEKILSAVVNIKTPKTPLPENFTIKWLDHYGRVAIITYRGAEVLLLFKKMTSQLKNLALEVAPRAYLKTPDDAWEAIKLVDIYTGVSIGERVKELEKIVKQKDAMLEMMRLELEASNDLCAELQSKKRKKLAKTAVKITPAVIQSSLEINKYLLKIKSVKLQDMVRASFLHSQGFNTDLVHGQFPAPETPVKYRKKVYRHLSKIDKMRKKAKLDKELTLYAVRPLPIGKKKVVKKNKKP